MLTATAVVVAEPAMDRAVYDKAARFLVMNAEKLVTNRSVTPHWRLAGGEAFTYLQERGAGEAVFVRIDANTGGRSQPFDARVVAQGLEKALRKPVDPLRLPFKDYDEAGSDAIRFAVDGDGTTFTCSTAQPFCAPQALAPVDPLLVPSPDGRWLVFARDNNLWIRATDGGGEFPLSSDGEAHYAYGGTPESNPLITEKIFAGQASAPVVLWSPDSRHLLTQRLDERGVRQVSLVQSTPLDGTAQPRSLHWRYPMAADAVVPIAEPWLFDLSTRTGRRVPVAPIPTLVTTSIEAKEAWWSNDGSHVYLFARSRFFKSMSLYEIDVASAQVRTLITETGVTFVEAGSIGQRPMVYTLASGDVVWFSERDGRGHLYLYDGRTGRLKRRLTAGEWSVRGVLYLDEAKGYIYVAGTEREPAADPYYRSVYRVGLADAHATLLTPEDADHQVASAQDSAYFDPPPNVARSPADARGFSPTGRYFLDTYSRADLPPRTVLRRADGEFVAEIERADISAVTAGGLRLPERFSALAADGKTRLYGNILRPSNFDPHKRYPVVDSLYPGPQARKAYPRLLDIIFGYTGDQTLAELGLVVVQLDGRGTPGRSKTFLDESYGKLGQAGHLDDHVAVLKQLAERYPEMDLDRVGAFGGSAGGYASLRAMLLYPDFFKVAVSAAGSHDPRAGQASYGDVFMGPNVGNRYRDTANAPLVSSLKGKLLLIQGEMDWTVLPANTLQVVDALIKHNKDFELLIVPNVGHSPIAVHGGYVLRRSWDFLVENLLHVQPPIGYDLSGSGVTH